MRVIAGSAGGLSLTVPNSVTRPTPDRVREALFSSLGERIIEARILDLYAGSGALGIEALSRGAGSVVFVEENERAAQTIRDNLERTRLPAEVRRMKVSAFLNGLATGENRDRFDLVFADPPYARDDQTRAEIADLLASEALVRSLASDGLFVLEGMDGAALPLNAKTARWTVLRERRYGGTRLFFLSPLSGSPE